MSVSAHRVMFLYSQSTPGPQPLPQGIPICKLYQTAEVMDSIVHAGKAVKSKSLHETASKLHLAC